MSLKQDLAILDRIAAVSSRSKKAQLLQDGLATSKTLKKVIVYALHPYRQYNTTQCVYLEGAVHKEVDDIFKHLDMLYRKGSANRFDNSQLFTLASIDRETVEVVSRIVNKDLRCGLGIKTVMEYIPELPTHDIQLCDFAVRVVDGVLDAENKAILKKFFRYAKDRADASDKLDGVRDWSIVHDNDKTEHLSRNGKPYPNFHRMNADLTAFVQVLAAENELPYPVILDGEVEYEGTDFQGQMSELRRLKEANPDGFRFRLFDCPSLSTYSQMDRTDILQELLERMTARKELSRITFVGHRLLEGDLVEDTLAALKDALARGKEGLVLKALGRQYEFKRSKNWCKVKPFMTGDFKIVSIEEGEGKYVGMLGAFWVEVPGGKNTKVGSGYNDEQRREWFTNDMVGKVIEVEFQRYTNDRALWHPTFKRLREDI